MFLLKNFLFTKEENAMGLVSSVKSFMGYEDEYEDGDIFESTDEGVRFKEPKEPREPSSRGTRTGRRDRVVSMYREEKQDELVIMQPSNFEDTQAICERMKERKPVVVNIEEMDTMEAQRAVDFLCGAVCALDSKINKVSNAIFVIVPKDMEISGDLREDRKKRSSYSF
jgi:cell division inhibitor SepF